MIVISEFFPGTIQTNGCYEEMNWESLFTLASAEIQSTGGNPNVCVLSGTDLYKQVEIAM
jgi:hypothetical protein